MPETAVHKSFKIYKSSAGSGKTFTLVREYLGIVLKAPEAYRNVLAITFTNKAAGEMKERIIRELRTLADGEASPMYDTLVEEMDVDGGQIVENARIVLAYILHDYANFAVSTIDSFTYKLIRNFARDLDLPSKFDVETDTEALLARMIDQLMDRIGRDPFITQILIHFAEEKLKNESNWHVDRDISEVARELFKESSKAPLNKLHTMEEENFIDFIEYIRAQKDAYPEAVAGIGKRATELIRKHGLQFGDFFGGARSSCVAAFARVQRKLNPADYQKYITTGRFAQAQADDKWYSKQDRAAAIEGVLAAGLRAMAQELVDYHEAHFNRYLTAWHAYQNIHSLAVLKQVEDLIDLHKNQHNLVHISDFQAKISDFIQNETPDYIYWRLGERFRHYLLDEFQDTSLLQWLNLYPLFDYIRTDPDRDGSLLLVGDSKQAIYRWRGGEIDLLEVVAPAQLDVEPGLLDRNYRSQEYVVDFNNRFFGKVREILSANPFVRTIYTDFEQKIRPDHANGGFVRMMLLDSTNNEDYKAQALERCRSQIETLTGQGYQLRDIAILVRTGRDGSEIAQFLSGEGIRVISSESILLHKAPMVNFIVSLLRFLVEPSDQIPRAEVLHYYFLYLHSDTITVEPTARIREILKDEKPIQAVYEQLPKAVQQLRYKLDQLPLYELVEEIVRIFDLRNISPAYLQHFLDVVLEYGERKKPDLPGFLNYWDDKKAKFSVVVPGGENAVEIMTIHKSKGLEFPVVIMPSISWKIQPQPTHSFWAKAEDGFGDYPDTYLVSPKKDLADSHFAEDFQSEINKTILDNVNLLYVAFTRPRDRLYIYSPLWKRKSSGQPTMREISSADRLLNLVMEDEEFQGMDNHMYETGFAVPPNSAPNAEGSAVAEDFISESWRQRIRIERRFRKYWESAQDETQAEIEDATIMYEALKRMTEAEELLLLMNDLQEEGLVDEQRKWKIEEQLEALLQTEPLKSWYQDGIQVRRATEILDPRGEVYAPDRVILEGEHAIVIEFVDGTRKQTQARQLKRYAATLMELGLSMVDIYYYHLPEGRAEQLR